MKMRDELMWVISDELGCARRPALLDDEVDYCTLHGDDWPCEEPHRIATALAPLIEARVREARADALTEVAESLRDSAATVEKAKGATQRTWFMREMVGVLTNRAREVRRG